MKSFLTTQTPDILVHSLHLTLSLSFTSLILQTALVSLGALSFPFTQTHTPALFLGICAVLVLSCYFLVSTGFIHFVSLFNKTGHDLWFVIW